jgi:ribosome-binding protein aMBF1 (putative translation factor)
MSKLDQLMKQIEAEAEAEGPEAVADLAALRTRYRIARELRAARQTHGLTQQQLAEMTGIDQGDISRIETGEANPTLETLSTIGAAIGVDLHALTPEQSDALTLA